MSRVPRIRFKGFEEDWEQRKLGEVCNIITKQTGFDYSSTIKPALLKEKADNTYPFIQNKDFNGTTINMDTDFFIPISVAEKFPNIVLDRPSLLISISGRIGNVGFYSCVHKAFIGGAVGICKLKYNDDGKFIIHELESEYGQKYFHLLIKASSHANITVEDIRNMELIFPNKKEEKVYISTFFSTLDHLITLHQRKLEKLKIIKKSMLENLFPQNDKKTPKIRFSGFTKDWEQRKFSDLYEKVIEKNDLSFGTDRIISVASMYYKEDTSNSYDDYMRTYNVMRLGDIAFEGNKSKNFAHGRFVENTIGDGIVSHVFDVFRPISEYDLLFWKYFINYEGVMGRIMIRCTKASTMMTNLVAKDFLEESIVVPSIVEQKRIGYYLKSLDHLITLHQSKLEKLQKIKKSMLESMFV